MIQHVLLGLSRTALTFWCGGAVLFVLVTVNEILSGQLDTLQLDKLVLLRFPIFYQFSFLTLIVGWLSLMAFWLRSSEGCRWLRSCVLATSLSLVILLGDYLFVYQPLREMLLPLGSPRPQSFHQYHQLTEWLNTMILLLNALAAMGLNFVRITDRQSEKALIPQAESD